MDPKACNGEQWFKKKKKETKNGGGGADVVFPNPLLQENFRYFARICYCGFLVFLVSS